MVWASSKARLSGKQSIVLVVQLVLRASVLKQILSTSVKWFNLSDLESTHTKIGF